MSFDCQVKVCVVPEQGLPTASAGRAWRRKRRPPGRHRGQPGSAPLSQSWGLRYDDRVPV